MHWSDALTDTALYPETYFLERIKVYSLYVYQLINFLRAWPLFNWARYQQNINYRMTFELVTVNINVIVRLSSVQNTQVKQSNYFVI